MEYLLTQFAVAETAEKADLFGSIGIDWRMLVLQLIAFLILLAILKKWVYPPLVAMLDKREKELRASAEAAREASQAAADAEAKTAALLKEARAEASDIVATAREEATATVEAAGTKAIEKADAIVAAARHDIAKEVESARKALHNETLELVATASSVVLGEKVDAKTNAKLIEKSLGAAKGAK